MKTLYTLATALVVLAGFSREATAQDRTGYVMRVEGRLVFIDLGTQDEVIPNDLFRLIRQETIIHPVTGENLGGEVSLGVIRIVEIFPRYSTAEILKLDPGADIRMMEAEAKTGLIRVKMLSADEQMDIQNLITRKPMVRSPAVISPSTGNPDGEMRSIVPEFRIGGGSPVETNLPDRAWQLVSDPLLLVDADTTSVDQALENFNGSLMAEIGMRMPLSNRASFVGELGVGGATKLALGGRFYPGSMFGSGLPTPSGHVGEPSFTVTLGYGGRGSSSLPASALAQLVADQALTIQTGFEAVLADTSFTYDGSPLGARQAEADSVYSLARTDSIRSSATDSLDALARKGLGFGLAVQLPVTEQIKLDAGLDRFGSIEELSFGVTFYQKRMGAGDANPDGVLRSFIGEGRVIFDTHSDKTSFDLGLTYPVTGQYTVSAGFISDFSGFSQLGLSIRGYINRN